MRILITGAGGTLGTALAPELADAGHEPVLFDVRPLDGPYEIVQGDIRRIGDVRTAMAGSQLVVHTAAIHGIHLGDHTAEEFFDLNLRGTFNTWEAAAEAKVGGVVFSSTMGVYGESRRPAADDEIAMVHEDLPLRPTEIYGVTKVAGEELCRYYGRRFGIPSVALRYGMFVPEPFFRYGIRLLYGGVDTGDVVGAVLAAIDALAAGRTSWDALNVESRLPFVASDGPELRTDPLAVLDRYWPGAGELLRGRGVERLQPIQEVFSVARLEERLGFRPRCNFEDWLSELASRPEERAPANPPWP
jgi:nucleoside-diphosphate-sugar epimerase